MQPCPLLIDFQIKRSLSAHHLGNLLSRVDSEGSLDGEGDAPQVTPRLPPLEEGGVCPSPETLHEKVREGTLVLLVKTLTGFRLKVYASSLRRRHV